MNPVQQAMTHAPEWLVTAKGLLAGFGLKLATAVLIFVIGRWIAKGLRALLERSLRRAHVDSMLVPFTSNLAYAAVLVFSGMAALDQLGVETASLVALLGAGGLAIGLALQGSLSNFAAGVLIVLFRPFRTGDFIEGGGQTGVVRSIQLFTTTLSTLDNKRVIVPNSKMMGDSITNYSVEGARRLDLTASISYRDSVETAKATLLEVLYRDPRVLKEPAPFIGVSSLANSGVELVVRPWVKPADYWDAFFALNEAIKGRLEAEGMTIPFPQRDVHLYSHDAR
jgi:small conductance mechanosensitive channel